MSSSYDIPGLVPVKALDPTDDNPGSLSDAEVSEDVRYWDKPQCDPTTPEIAARFVAINAQLQEMVGQNLNNDLVGVDDFNIAVFTMGSTNQQFDQYVPGGKSVLWVNKKTGKDSNAADLVAPSGGNQTSYDRTTANMLVKLAVPDPS